MSYCEEASSQNLVPNSDFEDTTACPNGAGAIFYSLPWTSYLESPDYFNTCALSCHLSICFGIPDNVFGSQVAYSGNGYAGLVTYSYNFTNARETMGVPLVHQLVIEKKYYFSCYISRAEGLQTHGASNNFGFRFSTMPYNNITFGIPIDNFSHYHDTTIISDSISWTKISGSFIADSAYQYLALGNFYDDAHTDTIDMDPMGQPWNDAYYYVDYVCVTEDSTNCNPINQVNSYFNKKAFSIYPNPFNDRINIKTEETEECTLIIYDIIQRKILIKKFSQEIILNTETLERGIYFYSLTKNGLQLKAGKLVKE